MVSGQADEILKHINKQELAELTRDLVDVPSPTGHEQAMGEFMLDWFRRAGLTAVRQDVAPGRINAVGILSGSGGGASLMINGHLDTSFTGTDEDRVLTRNLDPVEDLRGAIRDGKVYGLGASNMKCGLAAFMMAGKALKQSGVPLKGDLILAGVVGEISRTPIGVYQSEDYRGEGAGTRHLLTHGVQSDYAICADGSALSVIRAQTGVAQFKITTFGKPRSVWGKTRKAAPPKNDNAILKMLDIIAAVDAWGEDFEERFVYQSRHDGPIISKVNIGAIAGGAPYRPNYSAGICELYVDVRFPPKTTPVQVQRELRAVLAKTEHTHELEMYRSMMAMTRKGSTM